MGAAGDLGHKAVWSMWQRTARTPEHSCSREAAGGQAWGCCQQLAHPQHAGVHRSVELSPQFHGAHLGRQPPAGAGTHCPGCSLVTAFGAWAPGAGAGGCWLMSLPSAATMLPFCQGSAPQLRAVSEKDGRDAYFQKHSHSLGVTSSSQGQFLLFRHLILTER